jgi:hypothetical protein
MPDLLRDRQRQVQKNKATVNQSTHQCTIHWMPVITHLWMNLNCS